MEDNEQWQTVQTRPNKKNVLMKLKGTPSMARRESFKAGDGNRSGKKVARVFSRLTAGGMDDFVGSVSHEVVEVMFVDFVAKCTEECIEFCGLEGSF